MLEKTSADNLAPAADSNDGDNEDKISHDPTPLHDTKLYKFEQKCIYDLFLSESKTQHYLLLCHFQ